MHFSRMTKNFTILLTCADSTAAEFDPVTSPVVLMRCRWNSHHGRHFKSANSLNLSSGEMFCVLKMKSEWKLREKKSLSKCNENRFSSSQCIALSDESTFPSSMRGNSLKETKTFSREISFSKKSVEEHSTNFPSIFRSFVGHLVSRTVSINIKNHRGWRDCGHCARLPNGPFCFPSVSCPQNNFHSLSQSATVEELKWKREIFLFNRFAFVVSYSQK